MVFHSVWWKHFLCLRAAAAGTILFPMTANCLTIAGSDSGGGAGIQMDLAVFRALETHGLSAITCLTAQNPETVRAVHPVPTEFLVSQLSTLVEYFPLGAVKTGMLFNEEIISEVSAFLQNHPRLPVVIDPVMVATSGAVLLQEEAIYALREKLLPRATLVTPNLDEVAVLTGSKPTDLETMRQAGRDLFRQYQSPFLIKGGHLEGDQLVDVLILNETEYREFPSSRISGLNTHGSGCLLAAAIAASLARGHELEEAVTKGLAFFQKAANHPQSLGPDSFLNPR